MLLILLGLLVELYRPIRTYLTVKNEDPVVNVEFGSLEMSSLTVWKCGVLRTEQPLSATVSKGCGCKAMKCDGSRVGCRSFFNVQAM